MKPIKVSHQLNMSEVQTIELSQEDFMGFITKNEWCASIFKSRAEVVAAKEILAQSTTSNRRNRFFIETPSVFGLDIDNAYTSNEKELPELSIEAAKARLEGLGYSYILGPSKSHRIDKGGKVRDRYRVILFLETPIPNAESYAATFKWLKESIFPEADRQCKDLARFYSPCTEIYAENLQGKLIRPIEADPKLKAARATRQPQDIKRPQARVKFPKFFHEYFSEGAKQGERDDLTFKVAGCLRSTGLTEDEAYERIITESPILESGFSEREVRKCVRQAFQTDKVWELEVDHNSLMRNLIATGKIVMNIENAKDTILLSNGYTDRQRIDLKTLQATQSKEEYAVTRSKITSVVMRYCPFDDFVIKEVGEKTVYNTYIPPEWKKDLPPAGGEAAKLPELYERFFRHLVNDDEPSYEYLLNWLAMAVKKRNYTVLTAIGNEGTGKGTLGKVMRQLFGGSNYAEVRDEIFKNKFNAQLKDKRLVFIDEVKLRTPEETNRLNAIVNPIIEVERKGVDASEVTNHASYYIASNHMNAVKPSASDRRFSIIEMTNTKLLDKFSQEELNRINVVEDVAILAQFLLERPVDDIKMMRPFRSSHFEDVKASSMSEWEDFLIETFATENVGRTFSDKSVKEAIVEELGLGYRPPGRRPLETFCKQYPKYFKFARVNGRSTITIVGSKYPPANEQATFNKNKLVSVNPIARVDRLTSSTGGVNESAATKRDKPTTESH